MAGEQSQGAMLASAVTAGPTCLWATCEHNYCIHPYDPRVHGTQASKVLVHGIKLLDEEGTLGHMQDDDLRKMLGAQCRLSYNH